MSSSKNRQKEVRQVPESPAPQNKWAAVVAAIAASDRRRVESGLPSFRQMASDGEEATRNFNPLPEPKPKLQAEAPKAVKSKAKPKPQKTRSVKKRRTSPKKPKDTGQENLSEVRLFEAGPLREGQIFDVNNSLYLEWTPDKCPKGQRNYIRQDHHLRPDTPPRQDRGLSVLFGASAQFEVLGCVHETKDFLSDQMQYTYLVTMCDVTKEGNSPQEEFLMVVGNLQDRQVRSLPIVEQPLMGSGPALN